MRSLFLYLDIPVSFAILLISKRRLNPPVIVKKLVDAYSFKFTTTKEKKGEEYFPGYFLDLQKLDP